jgi:DNA helicase-2/ATP-dependent DNA helicase PcrA
VNPDDLLDALDDQQREAAMALVGPVCVLAGAGTGKTRTVTHRIAYGIAKGYFAANRVMALTYTNRAAGELRSRLRSLGIPGVTVRTFHAAALSQLEYFWPQYAGVPAPRVLESKSKLLAQICEEKRVQFDSGILRDLAAEIEWRKFTVRSLEEYADVVANRPAIQGISPAANLEIQAAYEDAKVKAGRLDWEDVLVLTLGLLRAEPRALAHVQQQYRFYTVDEYQDISPLQHALLDVWLGSHNDLCVVGDPNQTIYSFTGASSEFLRGFSSRYEDATVVQLTRNYRSTAQIIACANRLARQESGVDPLESVAGGGRAPALMPFANPAEEAKAVAAQIAAKVRAGAKASEIAILYRVNGQSETFENALAEHGIEVQVRGGERFFSRPEIQQAIRAMRAEASVELDKPLFQRVSDIVRALGWQSVAPDGAGSARDKWESLNALVQIVDELPDGSNLHAFVNELDERARSQHEPTRSAVTLSTIHAAKGLEWDDVYLVGANEGYLPISYAKTDSEIAEERRLFYVGITRAKTHLWVSWNRPGGESRFISQIQPGIA